MELGSIVFSPFSFHCIASEYSERRVHAAARKYIIVSIIGGAWKLVCARDVIKRRKIRLRSYHRWRSSDTSNRMLWIFHGIVPRNDSHSATRATFTLLLYKLLNDARERLPRSFENYENLRKPSGRRASEGNAERTRTKEGSSRNVGIQKKTRRRKRDEEWTFIFAQKPLTQAEAESCEKIECILSKKGSIYRAEFFRRDLTILYAQVDIRRRSMNWEKKDS